MKKSTGLRAIDIATVQSRMLTIRNQQVLLDRDVAALYGVETKALNQAVKRNAEKFPEGYILKMTEEECSRSQIVTLNGGRGSNLKYLPYVFTERGLYMLATVLKSARATQATLAIIETYAQVRSMVRDMEAIQTEKEGGWAMRIMATSDLHGNLEGLNPTSADVVVLAGDIAPLRGRGVWHINDQKKWINKRFREWTASYPDIQFVVIPGNHDFYPIAHVLFKGMGIDWGFGFSSNVHFLGDRGAKIGGVKFYGTPWVPIISYSWAFEGEHDTLVNWFSKIPSGVDVLVTHSPPRIPGSDVDRSLQTGSEHFGSAELTEAIMEKRPRFVFCGHIHTGQHGGVDLEGSRIYNVSRLDERYEIAYEPTWVDV